MTVRMIDVASWNIAKVGFDATAGELHVLFKTSQLPFRYPKFTQQDFDELLAAESIGSHFARCVKPMFDCIKPEPPAGDGPVVQIL